MSPSHAKPSAHFNDSVAVSACADKARRLVPGWSDLQKMAALLVAERTPEQGSVLVVGAGGGVELKAFAEMYPQWRFVGVDPSKAMLALAVAALGPLVARAELHHVYVKTAPAGPFDAATCLLTMHFVAFDERRRTLKEIRCRLKPGAPFVVAHMSFPQRPGERELWLSRYVAFAITSGVDAEAARNAASEISSRLPLLGPDDEEALLKESGFTGAQLFYAGLAFRGWVAYAWQGRTAAPSVTTIRTYHSPDCEPQEVGDGYGADAVMKMLSKARACATRASRVAVHSTLVLLAALAAPTARAAPDDPWPLAGQQGMVRSVIVPMDQARDRAAYVRQVRLLCEPNQTCFLNFYTNSTEAPLSMPLPDAISNESTAAFRRSAKQGTEIFRWNCRLQIPNEDCF